MSRPATKNDLVAAAAHEYTKLTSLIDSLPDDVIHAEFAFEDRDRTVRDVLWHLHIWHSMLMEWHRIGVLEGGMPVVPAIGYTWRTTPMLNQKIWEEAQSVDFSRARNTLEASHHHVLELIDHHANEELFSFGVYAWTKSTTLGSYFVSATSSHYDWAIKKVRKHKRTFTC